MSQGKEPGLQATGIQLISIHQSACQLVLPREPYLIDRPPSVEL